LVNFENGRGLKLIGNRPVDDSLGYIGQYANSIHPHFPVPKQNAKLYVGNKCATSPNGLLRRNGWYEVGDVGYFPLLALKDILVGEEIIVDYGRGYWRTMEEWHRSPKVQSQTSKDRDSRSLSRNLFRLVNLNLK
jgi:hypothetical protein